MGGEAGPPPGQAHLLGAALVHQTRLRDGLRAGHPLRGPPRHRTTRHYSTIDPEASRELFIRHALVQGEWQTQHKFFHANRALLDDVEELEHRARRRDILVDDETLFEFYDERVGAEAVSARHFDTWWKKARRENPNLLNFTTSTVVNADSAAVLDGDYPDAWRQGDIQFPLTYQFEPGKDDDGVTARIPVALLAGLRPVGFDWLVPGMRTELVTALIKTLPKQLRRQVVPAPDFAAAALAAVKPRSESLVHALARELSRLGNCRIEPTDFDVASLPPHLRMTFAAVDDEGKVLGRDKSLTALRRALAPRVEVEVSKATATTERKPALVWTAQTLGTLPSSVTRDIGGQKVTGYPALVAEESGVAVRVLTTPSAQRAAMQAGTRELLLKAIPTQAKSVTGGMSNIDRLALGQNPDGSFDALLEDCRACAVDELIAENGGPVQDPAAFEELSGKVRAQLATRVARLLRMLLPSLTEAHRLSTILDRSSGEAADDVREQRESLLFPGSSRSWGPSDCASCRGTSRQRRCASSPCRAAPSGTASGWTRSTASMRRTTGCCRRCPRNAAATTTSTRSSGRSRNCA